ncbi:MAG TPA: uroporphyrinogen decarboxylase family protein, partial [candidate division Zixibacteria bacterium]|nr:uroporphyrinogen decarboxylase family protein [candidate division Zixibacteria bacterium]
IKAAGDDAMNLLHVCSSHNFLKEICKLDYPYAMLNWDCEHPTNMPLDKAVGFFADKALVGGVDHTGWLLKSNPDEIKYKMDMLKEKYDSSRVIIGPGCSIPPEVPMANLKAIRESL